MKRYSIQILLNDRWRDLQHYRDMRRCFALGAWSMLKSHYNNTSSYRLVNYRDVVERSDLEIVANIHPRIVS